ncbi:putative cytochrome P450 [Annulohypoxylon truncatum]|uniref:putative cytochrome P450 n=1 Tax=Annulohypoxylon truncatum TaxID=327061 RepID=UPI0020086C71|nr:putative cytochrome P450 [Annulohypoxylon truncatum]KAI1214358.1 putative cytochrome P450 [Annulohypoxylon truncatum]
MEVLGGVKGYQLFAIAIGIALLSYIYTVLTHPLAKIPGPWYTKWTMAPFKYQVITGKRPKWVHALHEKYGPIVRISPIEVSIQDLKAVQQMYHVKNEFRKSSWYADFNPGLPNVFSTTDLDYHRRHRRLLAAEISESGLVAHRPTVDSKVRLAVERIAEEMEERGAADVYRWTLYMATDVIGELSFGSSFRMLETKEETQYIRDLKMVGFAGGLRATFPFLTYITNYIRLPVISVGTEVRNRLREYANQSLGRHYKLVEEQGDDAKLTLLSKLYRANEKDGETLPFHELREDAMAYITAGSDTTTNTLTYLFWAVGRDPAIRQRLVAEIRTLPDNFEDPDVKKLTYLDNVIQETLRLYSAAPAGLPRLVPPEGATLAGYFIPGGITVSAQAYSMHRNPDVYPNPLKFDPSRWENPTKAMKDSFVPFGAGSRVCLGLHLARMELRLMTARFFTRFPNAKPSTLEGFTDDDMDPKMFFLMQPKNQRCLIEAR